MNEFVADYKPESINKNIMRYRLKTKKKQQRINGLRSSDRENKIFNYFKYQVFNHILLCQNF